MKNTSANQTHTDVKSPTSRVDVMAGLVYILAALAAISPVLTRMSTAVYGTLSDAQYYLWLSWWRRYSLQNGLDYFSQPVMQAPFGAQQIVPGFSGLVWCLTGLSALFGEVAAYNLMIGLSFVLAGFLAYLLFRQFVDSRPVALLGGLAFAYSPIAMEAAGNHVDVAQQWVIPACLLMLIIARRRQSAGAALGLGVSFALAIYFNPYFAYAVVIAAVTFFVVDSIYLGRGQGWRAVFARRRLLTYSGGALIALILSAPELISLVRFSFGPSPNPLQQFNTLQQPDVWFYAEAARPWDFFLPSTHHPLFGEASRAVHRFLESLTRLDFTSPALDHRISLDQMWYAVSGNASRHGLYVGFAVLAMALVGLRAWYRSRLSLAQRSQATENKKFYPIYFLVLFIVILIFMQPPYLPVGAFLRPLWDPLKNIIIPTPTLFTMTFLSPLRVVVRIFPAALLSLLAFSTLGLEHLISRHRRLVQTVILTAFMLITFIEYALFPGYDRIPSLEHADWLAEQPSNTIIAYYPAQRIALAQIIHHQPVTSLINRPATPIDTLTYTESLALDRLDRALPKLAALGVRYVIVPSSQEQDERSGLRLAAQFDDARVYEVTAEATPLFVTATYDLTAWTGTANWAWDGGTKKIIIWNTLLGPTEISISLAVPAGYTGGAIEIYRTLTPHPESIILFGTEMSNPFFVPGYDQSVREVGVNTDGRLLEPIVVKTGETGLVLRWIDGQTPVDLISLSTRPVLTSPDR